MYLQLKNIFVYLYMKFNVLFIKFYEVKLLITSFLLTILNIFNVLAWNLLEIFFLHVTKTNFFFFNSVYFLTVYTFYGNFYVAILAYWIIICLAIIINLLLLNFGSSIIVFIIIFIEFIINFNFVFISSKKYTIFLIFPLT